MKVKENILAVALTFLIVINVAILVMVANGYNGVTGAAVHGNSKDYTGTAVVMDKASAESLDLTMCCEISESTACYAGSKKSCSVCDSACN